MRKQLFLVGVEILVFGRKGKQTQALAVVFLPRTQPCRFYIDVAAAGVPAGGCSIPHKDEVGMPLPNSGDTTWDVLG